MLHTKFQGHWSIGSGEEDFLRFLLYRGMATMLVKVHLHLGLILYAKYQDPSQSGSSVVLFTRLFLYKMHVSEKGE